MHKRLPLLAVCLAAAAFGASACGGSGDGGASASKASAPASAAPSAPSAPSGSPSAAPGEARGLTGLSAKLYLRTIRKNHPDLDRVDDDTLVAHGNALCLANGQALVDQVKKTKQELELTGKQASAVLGSAHGSCGRKNVFG
ncbi:hypothetical protein [Streptomyces caatingaensis]|uniref:DUF732 domain-containing protein n=1 Tax=Streptomyces caatingaensis TaxID=1678637 RepID=A0A0K9XC62_9ACTN|nr:hypothetical protein [Streptomyces caatingaensis]KNB51010.1 hypothetical protein AC230_17835 [Streptomyces caatingaensis]